jgi:carboxyl-terminal processing protease
MNGGEKMFSIPVRLGSALGVLALVAAFVAGFAADRYVRVEAGTISIISADAPRDVDLAPVWKAWKVIDEQFVPAAVASSTPLATTTLARHESQVWGMISGMTDALDDPYSFFLPPAEKKDFEESLSGSFEGVGMEIDVRDQVLTVVSPLKGTPAERAGMRAGDLMLEIDGETTKGLDVTAAVRRIRGPKGSVVTLLVMREGFKEPKEIKITRDVINVPIVTTTRRPDGIFVIEVASFTANSAGLYRNAMREFVLSGSRRLIIDLRGNPGGYLDAAVDMASWFLPAGKVVVTEDYAGHADNIVHRSFGYNVFRGNNPRVVILVNRGSASASEILAGALRDQGVAKLVGTRTFGKGSVQELIPITDDTSLKLTVAHWLTPSGAQIPLTGIVPDVEVTLTEEDITAKKDPQMDKAVEMLSGTVR